MGLPYTKDEVDYIESHLGILTYREMGAMLGRTRESIRGKVRQLGLDEERYTYPWTDAEKFYLLFCEHSFVQRYTGRGDYAICKMRYQLTGSHKCQYSGALFYHRNGRIVST